jgi:hypothetical protein
MMMTVKLAIGGWLLAVGGLAQCQQLEPARITSGGAQIEVSFAAGKIGAGRDAVMGWVKNAAEAVTEYYGRFPVEQARVMVRPIDGRAGIFHGVTYGGRRGALSQPAFTRISVGEGTTLAELDDDWTMTHEFLHLGFPDVSGESDEHHWMEEGMATYIEPIARARIGRMSAERVWGDFVRDMPQGLPQAGDQGLDRTHTWGRTYWGGAIFWLLADVGIREATGNRKGPEDAMRGIVGAGGNISEDWTVERVVAVGDQATGTTVLADLYAQMKATAVRTDLADLWRRMGVEVRNGAVMFDDRAPLAAIRKAITAAAPGDRPARASQVPAR